MKASEWFAYSGVKECTVQSKLDSKWRENIIAAIDGSKRHRYIIIRLRVAKSGEQTALLP
jgi:hypothetical protein